MIPEGNNSALRTQSGQGSMPAIPGTSGNNYMPAAFRNGGPIGVTVICKKGEYGFYWRSLLLQMKNQSDAYRRNYNKERRRGLCRL
ncbi:hypothetical protein MKMG_01915 [Methanogenium sp. MK-MG]|nr:hypothetical protein MKMG_01915 [Methanogenium sp. MK-MG]